MYYERFFAQPGWENITVRKMKFDKRAKIVSPSFSGKSWLLLKKPKLVLKGDVFVRTRYLEQFNDDFQAVESFTETNEYEGDIIVFD